MAIKWTEDLATGVDEIDDQHKELFKRINRLLDACKQGEGKEVIDGLMLFLSDYVVNHFGTEERLMDRYNYPESRSHRSQHENFQKRFTDLKRELQMSGERLVAVIRTNQLLGDWWINHIGKVDKGLGAFLRTKI
ncbi:MAG: bacteriohemerythrin [Nitrospirota bacterium]|jgi:hemerythrin